jgi:hypothetical protein
MIGQTRQTLYKAFRALAESKIRKLELDSQNPRQSQLAMMQAIVGRNKNCLFGREHNFAAIANLSDFQQAIPITDYEYFRPRIDSLIAGKRQVLTADDPLMFATTSGTTGKQKYIPITNGYIREFRSASVVSGYYLLKNYPGIANGITLSIVSPAEEGRTSGGIPYGAISGQLFKNEPFLIKKFISPIPYQTFLIKDYDSKYYALLRLALGLPVSLFYTLNPSTISLLCRRLQTYAPQLIRDIHDGSISTPQPLPAEIGAGMKHLLKPDRQRAAQLERLFNSNQFVPHQIWPTLQVVSCWTKAAAAFYLSDFDEYFGDLPISDITYGASEGRGTVFMGPDKQMLALHSHFFEFIPEAEIESASPTVLLADELEVGKNYFILFTTSAGLYRYNINDVVKVTGFHNRTPLLEFQYKGGNICSFTGEKITELQVTAAMRRAAGQQEVRFFTVVPQFRPEPHYELWLETENGVRDEQALCDRLAASFDEHLMHENIEYKTKRESQRLGPVSPRIIEKGTYEKLRRSLAGCGVADAQIKISHLNPKEETKAYLSQSLKETALIS